MDNLLQMDLHGLVSRFAELRLRDPQRQQQLTRSIAHNSQLVPVIAVAHEREAMRWVLIDGYRRLEALQQVGADLIRVNVWEHSVDDALLLCLARGPERAWEGIEEAALLQELAARHSLRDIAGRIGRDVSWVSRRLNLFKSLPEDLLAQVRLGRLSLWAATRILAPLARANSDHARTLLAALEQQPLSTRELKRLYTHYRRANRTRRERLVANPGLFVQALASQEEAAQGRRLAAGPEGAWYRDLAVIGQMLKRLRQQVPVLFDEQQPAEERQRLRQAFAAMKTRLQRLERSLKEVCGDDPP
jgi:ParB family chromosome partitioning protein